MWKRVLCVFYLKNAIKRVKVIACYKPCEREFFTSKEPSL